jgi:hypothetical protein
MRSPVVIVSRFALKFARNARGRASNLYEAGLYRRVNATRYESQVLPLVR